MSVYLYARVSTSEQTVENQVLAARKVGYALDHIFSDEDVSGSVKSTDRVEFFKMLESLDEGDTVVVSEISRIGRKTLDVLNIVDIFKKKKVRLCVLAYGNMDMTSEMGEVVITMASAFAQMELSDLKRRTKLGMMRTKSEGTKLGRPLKMTPEDFDEVVRSKNNGEGVDKVCKRLKLSVATAYKNLKTWDDDMVKYREEYNIRQTQYANAAILRA